MSRAGAGQSGSFALSLAEFAAQASVRVQQSVRSSGEAAGIAAALALQEGVSPRMLPPQAVRARMVARGARYAE